MLALDLDRGSSFSRERCHQVSVRQAFRSQEFEGNSFVELDVPGCDHETHAATAQELDHFVLPGDDFALTEGHGHRFDLELAVDAVGPPLGFDPTHRSNSEWPVPGSIRWTSCSPL